MIILGYFWLYLLKERTQVPTVIKDFINEIKTQFSTTIHVLALIILSSILKKFPIFVHLMVFYVYLVFIIF